MTLEGVIKNTVHDHYYVIGKERFRKGRWKFRVDQVKWVMFGVLEVSKAYTSSGKGWSYAWPGNYAIATNHTYFNSQASDTCMPFQAGDFVTVELGRHAVGLQPPFRRDWSGEGPRRRVSITPEFVWEYPSDLARVKRTFW